MYNVPPCTDKVLIEERQLTKWEGIFQAGIFWVRIYLNTHIHIYTYIYKYIYIYKIQFART